MRFSHRRQFLVAGAAALVAVSRIVQLLTGRDQRES
jgi:hypothetical protein